MLEHKQSTRSALLFLGNPLQEHENTTANWFPWNKRIIRSCGYNPWRVFVVFLLLVPLSLHQGSVYPVTGLLSSTVLRSAFLLKAVSDFPSLANKVPILGKVQLVRTQDQSAGRGPDWGTQVESASCDPDELTLCGQHVNTKRSKLSCSNRTRRGEPGPLCCSWSTCLCSSHLKQKAVLEPCIKFLI